MWVNLATLKEVKENGKLRVEHENFALLLTYFEGKVFAMNDKCPHLGTSLVKGTFVDGIVTCKAHHTMINVKNGEIVGKPTILFMKFPVKNAKTYSVKLEGDNVLVDLK